MERVVIFSKMHRLVHHDCMMANILHQNLSDMTCHLPQCHTLTDMFFANVCIGQKLCHYHPDFGLRLGIAFMKCHRLGCVRILRWMSHKMY